MKVTLLLCATALAMSGCTHEAAETRPAAPSAVSAGDGAFLAQAAQEPGAQKLPVTRDGQTYEMVFRELQAGDGPTPKSSDIVRVNYRGLFTNGDVFDNSAKHGGPASFPVDGVIPCWTEGVQHLKVGGKAKLTCPPELAYGESGAGGVIPPNTTLVFEVELVGIGG